MKRTFIALALLLTTFSLYVAVVNRNSKQMTVRQKVLKAIYPLIMWFSNKKMTEKSILSNRTVKPVLSFYSLMGTTNAGIQFDFAKLKGKKVLIVNTASNCGFTGQYDELEKLNRDNEDRLIVIGFPANDFKEQEKGTDEEIAKFCKLNFGVTFPLMKKSTVKKGVSQNSIFKWLSDAGENGWNNQAPIWNFSKYLVDEEGMLINYFGPAVSPLDKQVLDAIDQ